MKLAVVPYRSGDETESLRREVKELRAELTLLKGETLYPFSSQRHCRKCGVEHYKRLAYRFEAARTERWWRRGRPERRRVSCPCCCAVYYERTQE